MANVENLGFTLRELNLAILTGDVRKQVHPEFPELAIYNYTEDVQYRSRWNKITLACRGLILNQDTGEVIARPWEKFFNLGQMDNRIDSDAPVEVTDKMDGSLGILYVRPDNNFAIATRGSFASEQAMHATQLLHERYAHLQEIWINTRNFGVKHAIGPRATTYLFEIIYPENRIVVNYGDMDDLTLLGAVDNLNGFYYGPLEAAGMLGWTGPVTEVWKYDRFVDAISAPDRPGKEGYCIRSGSKIVKLKQADYVELHRIVTNLSPKTIWEMMGNGKTAVEICKEIPGEFHDYVTNIAYDLLEEASSIKFQAQVLYDKLRYDLEGRYAAGWGRKEFASLAIKHGEMSKWLFSLYDGRDISNAVWKSLKPRGDKLIKESV